MKTITLNQKFIDQLSVEQYKSLFITIRIYSVLNQKITNHIKAVLKKEFIISETIDSYCDLFATFNEGAKEYFKKHIQNINSIMKIGHNNYTNKMVAIYAGNAKEAIMPYNILYNLRNVAGFHFKDDFIDKYLELNNGERIRMVGFIDKNNNFRFMNIVPYIIEYLKTETKLELNEDNISKFFRETYQSEVKVFYKYLQDILHRIIDVNI